MKIKFNFITIVAVALACSCFVENAQARRGGTLPEDNSGGTVVDDHGGTNQVSHSGSGKNGGSKKVSEVKIKLVAAPEFVRAKGSARSRVRTDRQELQVEVQVSNSLAGSVLGVTIGDTVVGTMTVDALGKAELELSTENGDSIPVIQAGSLIGVVTGTGAIVLAGTF